MPRTLRELQPHLQEALQWFRASDSCNSPTYAEVLLIIQRIFRIGLPTMRDTFKYLAAPRKESSTVGGQSTVALRRTSQDIVCRYCTHLATDAITHLEKLDDSGFLYVKPT
ncbi:unnamed protein product [Cercospora beticola]|nr:unnamed protein product [Cercospora beticola]